MDSKKQKIRTGNTNRFEIRSADFTFENSQVEFLADQMTSHYPQSMHYVVTEIRALMIGMQKEAQTKLNFEAWTAKQYGDETVGACEVLYTPRDPDGPYDTFLPAVFSIEPLGEARKASIKSGQEDLVENGIEALTAFLTKVKDGESAFSSMIIKSIQVPFSKFAELLLIMLYNIQPQNLNLYSFEVQAEDDPKFLIEIGHRRSLSHFFLALFELEWPKSMTA